MRMGKAWAVTFLCCFGVFSVAGCATRGQDGAAHVKSRSSLASPQAREQVRQVIPAVGLVLVRNGGADSELRPRGSAVVVRKDGLVATNYHVVARDKSLRLYDDIYLSFALEPGEAATSAPRRYRLKPAMLNQERDLALLKITPEDNAQPTAFTTIEFGDSQKLELLDDLVVIGFPDKGGTTVTVNTGVVEGKDTLEGWIKTDARLMHGNSGGAAVNSEGKLIGIPTKVVVDKDDERSYGAVGYLRPANLVAAMLAKYEESESRTATATPKPTDVAPPAPKSAAQAQSAASGAPTFPVRGVVRTANGRAVAGARIGLLPLGREVNASTLITWGGSNAEGQFELEKPVPAGRYTLRAKALGYEAFSADVEVGATAAPVVIVLRASSPD